MAARRANSRRESVDDVLFFMNRPRSEEVRAKGEATEFMRGRQLADGIGSRPYVDCAAMRRAAILACMFSATLLDHFEHPRNAGELPGAALKIEVGNPVCGDILQLFAVLDDRVIREVRFLCRGCTASIACASLLTESIRGRELDTLGDLTPDSLAAALGGLPPASFHAAQLACDALQALRKSAEGS